MLPRASDASRQGRQQAEHDGDRAEAQVDEVLVVAAAPADPVRVCPDAGARPTVITMRDAVERARGPAGFFTAVDLVDVFVYVVVLNLAAEYVPSVIAETFTLSLFTAVVLKLVLEGVVAVKDRLKTRLKAATTPVGRVVAGLALWLVLVGSKFVVLELVALLFGDRVKLGGFFAVTGLILILLLARAGVRRLLDPPTAVVEA